VFDGQPDYERLVFAGIDVDKSFEGEIASLAEERIKRVGSYTEQSVSRPRLHVIVQARPLGIVIAHEVSRCTPPAVVHDDGCAVVAKRAGYGCSC